MECAVSAEIDLDDTIYVRRMGVTGKGRELCRRNRLSSARIAAGLNVDPSTVERWWSGRSMPALGHLRKYAALLRRLDGQAD